MRYVKQKTNFDCGPIAVINAMKWAGYNTTYEDVYKFRKYCKTSDDGTRSADVHRALKRFKKLKSKRINNVNKRTIKSVLKNLWKEDTAYIIGHLDLLDLDEGHFSFWVGRTEKYVRIININEKVERKILIANIIPHIEEIFEIKR